MDGVLIEQVLINLIDNVLEYTPPDSPIEIDASLNGESVGIEVIDHGPGLPPGTESRVFEKFFRIRPNESRRGIGLGLAIKAAESSRRTAEPRLPPTDPAAGRLFVSRSH